MALPDDLAVVTVTGTYLHPDGAPFVGRVIFTPEPAVLTSAAGDAIILGETVASLDDDGQFSVTLLATDDPSTTPTGWTYRVVERWWDTQGRDYPISLPLATPTVDLADIAPTAPAEGEYVVVTGPAGPEGPEGPQGPPGDAGGTYLHTQTSPAATWQVQHDLGRTPNLSVIDTGGRVVYADIVHTDDTLAVIQFPSAFAGTAMCS